MFRTLTSAILIILTSAPALAQDASSEEQPFERVVNRVVEPDSYWVSASKLRVRDDPFAGNVLRSLEWGAKVAVYEEIDHWMRITRDGEPGQWINGDFVSETRRTWSAFDANSNQNYNNTVDDINLTRIKFNGDKDNRIYAFNKLALSPEKRMVDTRQNQAEGSHFQRYLVKCSGEARASHIRFLGDGYSFISMYEDPRNMRRLEPFIDDEVIDKSSISNSRLAVAEYACGKRN